MHAPARVQSSPDGPFDSAVLERLLDWLRSQSYRFVTPTPATHARVIGRPVKAEARTIRDIFGWSLPFRSSLLPTDLFAQLSNAKIIENTADGLLRSRVRVSSLDNLLFLHSAYPTDQEDAVFFGPDSYRFARFIEDTSGYWPQRPRVVDLGAGSGVGGIVAGRMRPDAEVWLADVNGAAIGLAQVNARAAQVKVATGVGPGLRCAPGAFDVVLINPPYIIDAVGRTYRDGGDLRGSRSALDLTLEGAARLTDNGRLLLYTGEAIVEGQGALVKTLQASLPPDRYRLDWRERDPDVFGEELDRPEYADVERIALIEVIVTRVR